MEVDETKTIDLGNGHLIEFGKSSWNKGNSVSVRNRYTTKNGGFSPRSSSEIPIEDIKIIVEGSVKNGYLADNQLIDIAKICLDKLKTKFGKYDFMSKTAKLDIMKQAFSDKLFLADINEITDDFKVVDNENV